MSAPSELAMTGPVQTGILALFATALVGFGAFLMGVARRGAEAARKGN